MNLILDITEIELETMETPKPDISIVGLLFVQPHSLVMEFKKNTYQPARWIRYTVVSDRVVIMDLRTGKYILFDEVASEMWVQLLNIDNLNSCISIVADKYDIEFLNCKNDLLEFIVSCEEKELFFTKKSIEEKEEKTNLKKGFSNLFTAWNSIFKTKLAFKKLKFPTLYEKYSKFSKPDDKLINESLLIDALVTFRKAENFFSVNNARFDCLPRSLSLFRFLISIGIDCNHCIGIQRFPFGAHAWVEVRNKVVGDDDAFTSKFSEINRI